MAKFSEVAAGIRARRPAKLPLPGASVDDATGEWIGPTQDLEVRPLNEGEYGDVIAKALAFAKSKGLDAPEDGDPIYDRAKMLFTLAIACIDKDSPAEKPAPFFDGGVPQILGSEIMTPEVVAYLYEVQQIIQDDVAPMKKDLSPADFMAAALKTAQGNMAFFVNSRLAVRWNFVRFLASLYISSLANKLPSSPPSEPQTIPTESAKSS